jgi:hypothetical protein
MNAKRSWVCCLLAVLLLAGVGSAEAKKKRGGANPMDVEDGVLDEIHLKVATLQGGAPVVIRKFSTESTDFGTGEEGGKEGRVRAAETMKTVGPDLLAEALKADLDETGAFGPVTVVEGTGGSVPAGALVIDGEIVSMNPGSRAKRYFVGYGAGASGVGVAGRVTDASGTVLAEFKHLKHSGIGFGGGDYVKFMSDDAQDVGKDLAKFLATWAQGGDLTED